MKHRLAAIALVLTIFSPAAKNPLLAQTPVGPVASQSGNSSSSAGNTSYSAPSSASSPAAAQGQNSFTGSVPSKLVPGVLPISLEDAINRVYEKQAGEEQLESDESSVDGSSPLTHW